MSKRWFLTGIIVLVLIAFLIFDTLFIIRFFSPRQLDDLSPEIPCPSNLIQKSDILYAIPNFNNASINESWCREIRDLKKEIRMHGIQHTYEEFNNNISQEYLNQGLSSFEVCFETIPKHFKPGQLAISQENRKLIEKNKMILDLGWNQIFHRVYHCQDTGIMPNKLIDIF